jgi:hypothetical protein
MDFDWVARAARDFDWVIGDFGVFLVPPCEELAEYGHDGLIAWRAKP